MIASLSGAIAASPIGRSYVRLRDLATYLDWVIPFALVTIIAVASAWIAFGPR